jgi:hypothetical protein
VRRGTLIALVVLFVALGGAALYQVTLGGGGTALPGPETPGRLPPVVDSGIEGTLRAAVRTGSPAPGSKAPTLAPSSGTVFVFPPGSENELTEAPIGSEGAFRIALPPGTYRVVVALPPGNQDARADRTVSVRPHRFTRVDFRIRLRFP